MGFVFFSENKHKVFEVLIIMGALKISDVLIFTFLDVPPPLPAGGVLKTSTLIFASFNAVHAHYHLG